MFIMLNNGIAQAGDRSIRFVAGCDFDEFKEYWGKDGSEGKAMGRSSLIF